MKRALTVGIGAMLAAGTVTSVQAEDFMQYSAFHIAGTYTRVSNNGLSYGDLFQGLGLQDDARRHVFVSPGDQFDYALGFTYHVPGSMTRVFIHYDHFRDGDNTESTADIRNLNLQPPGFTQGSSSVTDRSDELLFGVSRMIRVGPQFQVDLGAFLEWDKIHRDIDETNAQAVDISTRHTENKMRGFGPGVGAKGHANPFSSCPNFGFFAGAMTTLLYTHNDFFQEELRNGLMSYNYDPESTHSIVGKMDISFGIDLVHHFQTSYAPFQASLALGMRYVNYFNAFKNGNVLFTPNFTPNGNFAANTGNPEDWGRMGPYLQFRIGGAEA